MTDDDATAWCQAQNATALTSPHGYVVVLHPSGLYAKGESIAEAVLLHQGGNAQTPTPALLDVVAQTLQGKRQELAVTVAGFDPSAPAPPPVDPTGGLGSGAIGDGT